MKGKLCRIRVGASVFQDRGFPIWGRHIGVGEEDLVFSIEREVPKHPSYDVVAYGYGWLCDRHYKGRYDARAYGNGGIMVKICDVQILSDEEAAALPVFEMPPKPKKQCREPGYYIVIGSAYEAIVKVLENGDIKEIGGNGTPGRCAQWHGPLDLKDLAQSIRQR